MKIGLAQVKAEKGNIANNLLNHKRWVKLAISEKTDLIVFPELSITGYEPELSNELATDQNDIRLNELQRMSDLNEIVIAVGLPTKSEFGIRISMVVIRPNKSKLVYSKQQLHSDEQPFFVEGTEQLILNINNTKIAPGICYESLQPEHAERAFNLGTEIYLASVAKPQNGIDKAFIHYPQIASNYSSPVLMVNSIGFCDNFESRGATSVWDENGALLGQLDQQNEGLLLFDTVEKTVYQRHLN